MFETLFDLEQAKRTNLLISGANHSGKTRLACGIASMLYKLGYTVQVIDVSGVWKNISDLPFYAKVYNFNGELTYPKLKASGIYDLSNLKLSESKRIVEQISAELWNSNPQKPVWLFCEESEAYLRNIRSMEKSEEFYRLIHIGRNRHIRTCLITVDLALLDASIIRACGIRYHGFLNIEVNSKKRFRAYYGKDFCRIALEDLSVGDFIRYLRYKRKIDVVSVREFKTKKKPKLYLHYEQPIQATQPIAKPSFKQDIRDLKKLFRIFS